MSMNLSTSKYRKFVDDCERDEASLNDQLVRLKRDKDETELDLTSAKEAQAILLSEAKKTQSEIEDHITGVVTLALSAVEIDDANIPKPPAFIARIVEKRNNTECHFFFKEGKREQHPLECSGFGYVDIADYIIWIAYLLLEDEYSEVDVRKTAIADEPFRNVDPMLQHKVSEMLQMISNDLKFQQIIVSHASGVNKSADKTIEVTKTRKVSKVTKGR